VILTFRYGRMIRLRVSRVSRVLQFRSWLALQFSTFGEVRTAEFVEPSASNPPSCLTGLFQKYSIYPLFPASCQVIDFEDKIVAGTVPWSYFRLSTQCETLR
jgi:hypothetical protein